jgi:hypothetical protein
MNRIGSLNISSRIFVALNKAMNLLTASFNWQQIGPPLGDRLPKAPVEVTII